MLTRTKNKLHNVKIILLLLTTSLITGCSEQSLNRTWFVVHDVDDENQGHYRSIYTFSPDTLSINYLGSGGMRTKIKSLTDSIIKTDSFPQLIYQLNDDTLMLRWPQTTLKLLPFKPKKTETSIEELEELIVGNNWIYEYEGMKFKATFLREQYGPYINRAQIQVYYDDKFDRILKLPLWKIEKLENQLILIIEDPMEHFYANVFYINGIAENGTLQAETWHYGSKYNISFITNELIDTADLIRRREQLMYSWKVISSSERKEPEIDPDDTTYVDLGHIPIWGTINMNTVIEESDLTEGNMSFNFLADSSYQLIKYKSAVCTGTWELLRNGQAVKLTTQADFSDEYQTQCSDFLIKKITDEELHIEQWIPIYENDSTVPQRYYELKLVKNMYRQR